MQLIQHDYQGSIVRQQNNNGYVFITDMAKSQGKKVEDYFRTQFAQEYQEALSSDTGFPVSLLIEQVKGNFADGRQQGTWVHPEIAIHFAIWCNAKFAVWAMRTLRFILENSSPIAEPDTKLDRTLAAQNHILDIICQTNDPSELAQLATILNSLNNVYKPPVLNEQPQTPVTEIKHLTGNSRASVNNLEYLYQYIQKHPKGIDKRSILRRDRLAKAFPQNRGAEVQKLLNLLTSSSRVEYIESAKIYRIATLPAIE